MIEIYGGIYKMDIQTIKAISPNLETVIETYWGPPVSKNTWLCGFHNDGLNPNFTIRGEQWRCWSTQCDKGGDIIDFIQYAENTDIHGAMHILSNGQHPSPQEVAELKHKREQAEIKRLAELHVMQQAASARMGDMMNIVDRYHSRLEQSLPYWQSQGITSYTAHLHKLGYANACPTYYNKSDPQETMPSYTIPYIQNGKLLSIKHRLLNDKLGKYRYQIKGQPNHLYGVDSIRDKSESDDFGLLSDLLEPGQALLLEGEKKQLFVSQEQAKCAAVPGALTWKQSWAKYFRGLSRIFVCLDPGVLPTTIKIILDDLLSVVKEVFVVELPSKIDDMFILYGGTFSQLKYYLEYAREAKAYI